MKISRRVRDRAALICAIHACNQLCIDQAVIELRIERSDPARWLADDAWCFVFDRIKRGSMSDEEWESTIYAEAEALLRGGEDPW